MNTQTYRIGEMLAGEFVDFLASELGITDYEGHVPNFADQCWDIYHKGKDKQARHKILSVGLPRKVKGFKSVNVAFYNSLQVSEEQRREIESKAFSFEREVVNPNTPQ